MNDILRLNEVAVSQSHALPYALCAIARSQAVELDPDNLTAALALGFLACAPMDAAGSNRDIDRVDWIMLARDSFLIDSARAFGMRLRPLHPPEAAVGLSDVVAFRQHFEASYRPLIRRAMENEQPVLAWSSMSEPGEQRGIWGLVRELEPTNDVTICLNVATDGRQSVWKDAPLTFPPVQLYVVESSSPHVCAPAPSLTLALDHAHRALRNERGSQFGVMTGLAALDAWLARAALDGNAGTLTMETMFAHASIAAALAASNASTVRFLARQTTSPESQHATLIATLLGSCRQIEATLTTWVNSAIESRTGNEPLPADSLSQAIRATRAAANQALAALAVREKTASSACAK